MLLLLDTERRFSEPIAMSSLRVSVAICWILLGAGLLMDGVLDWWSWLDNPILTASSLRWWHSTNIIPGLFAIIVGVLLWKEVAFARLAAFVLASVFTLYTIYIMLITRPERLLELRPMLALQILVLALSVVTAYYAVLGLRRSSAPADPD